MALDSIGGVSETLASVLSSVSADELASTAPALTTAPAAAAYYSTTRFAIVGLLLLLSTHGASLLHLRWSLGKEEAQDGVPFHLCALSQTVAWGQLLLLLLHDLAGDGPLVSAARHYAASWLWVTAFAYLYHEAVGVGHTFVSAAGAVGRAAEAAALLGILFILQQGFSYVVDALVEPQALLAHGGLALLLLTVPRGAAGFCSWSSASNARPAWLRAARPESPSTVAAALPGKPSGGAAYAAAPSAVPTADEDSGGPRLRRRRKASGEYWDEPRPEAYPANRSFAPPAASLREDASSSSAPSHTVLGGVLGARDDDERPLRAMAKVGAPAVTAPSAAAAAAAQLTKSPPRRRPLHGPLATALHGPPPDLALPDDAASLLAQPLPTTRELRRAAALAALRSLPSRSLRLLVAGCWLRLLLAAALQLLALTWWSGPDGKDGAAMLEQTAAAAAAAAASAARDLTPLRWARAWLWSRSWLVLAGGGWVHLLAAAAAGHHLACRYKLSEPRTRRSPSMHAALLQTAALQVQAAALPVAAHALGLMPRPLAASLSTLPLCATPVHAAAFCVAFLVVNFVGGVRFSAARR